MVSKDTSEHIAVQFQLHGTGLSPLVERIPGTSNIKVVQLAGTQCGRMAVNKLVKS